MEPWSQASCDRAGLAMGNELVLAKISRLMPAADLLTLRRTCTMWNGVMVPDLRVKHAPIQLINSPGGTKRRKCLREYNELMKRSQEIPFSAYNLCESKDEPQLIDEFLEMCSNSIRSVNFVFALFGGSSLVKTLRPALMQGKLRELTTLEFQYANTDSKMEPPDNTGTLPELPNLKRLAVGLSMDSVLGELVGELVQAASGLESLELNGSTFFPSNKREVSEVGLLALRNYAPRLDKLRELNISGMKHSEIIILNELASRTQNPLQPQSFSLEINRSPYRRDDTRNRKTFLSNLAQFLETQAFNLQKFRIKFMGAVSGPAGETVWIPKMDQLLHFSFLSGRGPWAAELTLEEGNLRDNFPRLRKLELTNEDEENAQGGVRTMEGSEDLMAIPHHGVSEVELTLTDLSAHMDQWRLWLPSVVHCHLFISASTRGLNWGAVWTTWPALEELYISYEDEGDYAGGDDDDEEEEEEEDSDPLDLDEFLTGIPASSHRSVRKELLQLSAPISVDKLRVVLDKYKTRPGITDLYQLKKFVMKAEIYSEEAACNWTDIGGYFGLAMATRLQHVQIQAWGLEERRIPGQISDQCLEVIQEILGPSSSVINV